MGVFSIKRNRVKEFVNVETTIIKYKYSNNKYFYFIHKYFMFLYTMHE